MSHFISPDFKPLQFGKYKGLTSAEISEIDPSYIVWLYDTIQPPLCSKELHDLCQQDEYDEEYEHDLDVYYNIDGWGD